MARAKKGRAGGVRGGGEKERCEDGGSDRKKELERRSRPHNKRGALQARREKREMGPLLLLILGRLQIMKIKTRGLRVPRVSQKIIMWMV